jgi:hypothetical protein
VGLVDTWERVGKGDKKRPFGRTRYRREDNAKVD